MDRAIKKNIQTIYCMTFCQSAMVVSAIFVPLLQRHDLTMAQVLQTQALFALVIAASEVPSGYLADVWGRKRALLVGQGLMALAYGWFIFADSFADFMVFEVVMGLGISLCSGADLALLYDSQKALAARGENTSGGGNHIARLVAVESYASALAAILASVLTLWSLDWVLWAQAIFAVAGFAFALRLKEVERNISLENHSDNAARVANSIVRQPLVLWTCGAIMTFGLASLLGFWLMQKYWESQQVPLYLFGYIWAAHGIVRGVSAHAANALEDYLGWRKLFLLVALLPIIGFCGMGLLGGWLGIVFGLLLPIGRGLSAVVFAEALNKRLESTFRATVNSVVSLGTRLLFMFTGPMLGYMVDRQGVSISFLALAVLFVPVYLVVLLALARSIKREPRLERESAVTG